MDFTTIKNQIMSIAIERNQAVALLGIIVGILIAYVYYKLMLDGKNKTND